MTRYAFIPFCLLAATALSANTSEKAGLAPTEGEGPYSIDWSTIGASNATTSGASYVLNGSIGQNLNGPAMAGSSFTVASGYWPALPGLQTQVLFSDAFE